MVSWTITVPDETAARILDSFAVVYPIPTGKYPVTEPLYTKSQWAKYKIKQWIKDRVALGEEKARTDAAKRTVDVSDVVIQVD